MLLIIILIIGIVGIIIYALTTRVIQSMGETSDKRISEMAYSQAEGALDWIYTNRDQIVSGASGDCVASVQSGQYTFPYVCTDTRGYQQEGQTCNTVVILDQRNDIKDYYLGKDDSMEVNVDGFGVGNSIRITVENWASGTSLIVKTISSDYSVTKEVVICANGSGECGSNEADKNGSYIYTLDSVSQSLKFIRIRAVITSPGLDGVRVSIGNGGTGNGVMPPQRYVYVSDSTCGVGTQSETRTRVVRTEYIRIGVQPYFDYVLFSGGSGISK